MRDITVQERAHPTSHEISPAARPTTPGVSRPTTPTERYRDPEDRKIHKRLAARVARFFGFTHYDADVTERVTGVYIIADLTKQQEEEETRTGADYRTFVVDLNTLVGSRVPIPGTKDLVVTDVALVQLSAAATFGLHVGDRDAIPFGGSGLGTGASVHCDPPERIALAITNPAAQPGLTATILVSSGVRVET